MKFGMMERLCARMSAIVIKAVMFLSIVFKCTFFTMYNVQSLLLEEPDETA